MLLLSRKNVQWCRLLSLLAALVPLEKATAVSSAIVIADVAHATAVVIASQLLLYCWLITASS